MLLFKLYLCLYLCIALAPNWLCLLFVTFINGLQHTHSLTYTHARTAVATICNCSAFINVAQRVLLLLRLLLLSSLLYLAMFTRSTTFCWSSTNHHEAFYFFNVRFPLFGVFFCLLCTSYQLVLRFLFDMLIRLYLICTHVCACVCVLFLFI